MYLGYVWKIFGIKLNYIVNCKCKIIMIKEEFFYLMCIEISYGKVIWILRMRELF